MDDAPQIARGRKFMQVQAAARLVFLRDGYAGASVDDIAREARVSKATLYSYFTDKRRMFCHIITDEMDHLAGEFRLPVSRTGGVESALTDYLGDLVALHLGERHVLLARVCIGEAGRFPDIARRYHLLFRQVPMDTLRAFLDSRVDEGDLHLPDTAEAAAQLLRLPVALLHDHALLPGGAQIIDAGLIRSRAADAARSLIAAARMPRTDLRKRLG